MLALIRMSPMLVWVGLLAAYGAIGSLKIRTFPAHQAHAHARARMVIIADCGPLAFLFLNGNLHVVHHVHPLTP